MSRFAPIALGFACALLLSTPLIAQEKKSPPPFKDFSSKRVGLPQPGQKRIRVQIGPEDVAEQKPPSDTAPPSAVASARYDWFWTEVSPALAATGPGRLDEAMRAIARSNAPVAAPRLQHMQDLAQLWGVDILRATIGTDVSPALVLTRWP